MDKKREKKMHLLRFEESWTKDANWALLVQSTWLVKEAELYQKLMQSSPLTMILVTAIVKSVRKL
jgi:hypothetical protein